MADFPNPTGRFAEDTRKLIDLLSAVDFPGSQLPGKILEDLQPGKRMCRLEYSTQVQLIQKLEHARQRVRVDIRPIDAKLMNLAQRFAAHVRGGDVMSTQMAHEALVRGIMDIRCNLPQDPAIPPEEFVAINAKYLEQWINLVQWAEVYDRQTKSLAEQRRSHTQTVAQLNASVNRIYNRIETDPDFAASFFHILDHDSPTDRTNWTQAQQEVHTLLVEHRIDQLTLKLSNTNLTALEQDLLSTRQKIDTLRVQLAAVPIVTDPDLMNKYRESMEQFIRDLAASDAFMEETLRQSGELEGALRQLDQTSGALRQQQAAAEGVRSTMVQLQKLHGADTPQQQDSPLRSDTHN